LPTRRSSVDGFELQFATNVLGHFLLTGLLLPAILRAPAPRVVTVSSSAHLGGGPVPVTDLNSETSYKPTRAYSKTKLENVLFAQELQRRAGSRLFSVACHPGYARTNLQFSDTSLAMRLACVLMLPFSQSAAQGAAPTLYAATSPDVKPGGYYGPRGLSGPVREMRMAEIAYDARAAKQLFDALEKMAQVHYAF
jgi:NAD(P)-dependent dehydrogenase (short-subunit alcohol dehydrogenase family)